MPKEPDLTNIDRMTNEEFHVRLQKGYNDMQEGRTQDAANAFAKFKETHSA